MLLPQQRYRDDTAAPRHFHEATPATTDPLLPLPGLSPTSSLAGIPKEENVNYNRPKHQGHPVLKFKTKKGEVPNQKLEKLFHHRASAG